MGHDGKFFKKPMPVLGVQMKEPFAVTRVLGTPAGKSDSASWLVQYDESRHRTSASSARRCSRRPTDACRSPPSYAPGSRRGRGAGGVRCQRRGTASGWLSKVQRSPGGTRRARPGSTAPVAGRARAPPPSSARPGHGAPARKRSAPRRLDMLAREGNLVENRLHRGRAGDRRAWPFATGRKAPATLGYVEPGQWHGRTSWLLASQ